MHHGESWQKYYMNHMWRCYTMYSSPFLSFFLLFPSSSFSAHYTVAVLICSGIISSYVFSVYVQQKLELCIIMHWQHLSRLPSRDPTLLFVFPNMNFLSLVSRLLIRVHANEISVFHFYRMKKSTFGALTGWRWNISLLTPESTDFNTPIMWGLSIKSYLVRFRKRSQFGFQTSTFLVTRVTHPLWSLLTTCGHVKTKARPLPVLRFYISGHNTKKAIWSLKWAKNILRWNAKHDMLYRRIIYLTKPKPKCRSSVKNEVHPVNHL